jgi:REP element-mobilizing transposase RayT
MPRPPRIEFPGAIYHVTSRGNGRRGIFLDDPDRERFLLQLAESLETYGVVLYAYALMGNHYHLLVQTPRGNLARFCQRLNTAYALYARYRQKTVGHILQGRYGARLVESEDYLGRVARYIHLNPARTREVRALPPAEQAERLLAYRWSSLPGYLAASKEEPFMDYAARREFSGDPVEARRAYRRFILAALEGDTSEMDRLMRASAYAVGSESFVKAVEERMRGLRKGVPADRDLDLPPEAGRELAAVDAAVAGRFGISPESLREHGNRCGPAKAVAVELAARTTGLTLRRIGEHYGLTSGGLCALRHRLEGNTEALHAVKELVERMEKDE